MKNVPTTLIATLLDVTVDDVGLADTSALGARILPGGTVARRPPDRAELMRVAPHDPVVRSSPAGFVHLLLRWVADPGVVDVGANLVAILRASMGGLSADRNVRGLRFPAATSQLDIGGPTSRACNGQEGESSW